MNLFENISKIYRKLFEKKKSEDRKLLLSEEEEEEDMIFISSARASTCSYHEIETTLQTNIKHGLLSNEAEHRQKLYGLNEFDVGEDDPLWKKYLYQFKEPMIMLLLASGCVSVLMGQYDDAISIAVAVFIVVTVAFIQEYRSDKSVEAITKLVPPTCKCIRDGNLTNFLAKNLVPGDIVLISTGDRIPADIRLFEANYLEIDESSFTGEIEPARKCVYTLNSNSSLPERSNMALMGTLVCAGNGKGIVCGTGINSEFGAVFQMMKEEEPPKTPLQKSMDVLGAQLSSWSIFIIGLIVILGWIQNRKILEMFTIGVSLAVAAIPEGLPIVVTVTLALGVMRMARRNAIVKRLPVVETLGCATVICSDKTGTLTKNEMTATTIVLADQRYVKVTGLGYYGHGAIMINNEGANEYTDLSLTTLIKAGCLCNNASIKNGVLHGQATEGAIIALGLKLGLVGVNDEYNRTDELPFSSEKKWMAVRCHKRRFTTNNDQDELYYVKGAPEKVLEMCTKYEQDDAITPAYVNQIKQHCKELGNKGLRVIAISTGKELKQMTFLGLIGIMDPPRDGVFDAISCLLSSGVDVKMVTGDARETAVSIAQSVGLATDTRRVVSGEQLDSMDQFEMKKVFDEVSVFYRVSPKNKLTIVKILQELGHVVAMTGDGVNDAIALKRADIGIAMGKCGTDVSKEAADMILADDDFKTIMAALTEGKGIYYNIRNFVRFQLSTSIAAISLITISTLMKLPNPLNAMQILWINIIMDGPPAQSLGVEPVDDDVLKKKPRSVKTPMINTYLLVQVFSSAALIVLGTLFIFWKEMSDNIVTPRDTTMTFTCFVFFDMFNALSCRSMKKSVMEIGLFSNRMFLYAVGGSLIGQMLVVYCPPLQSIFQTEALTFIDIITLLAIASTVLLLDEIRKLIYRLKHRQSDRSVYRKQEIV